MTVSRFAIKRSPLWRPLLALFGATDARSWVELTPEYLTARLGFFQLRIPRGDIDSAARAPWPFFGGIGWRSNLVSVLGLVGATAPIVCVQLRHKQRSRLLGIPIRFDKLYLSLEDPDGFLHALETSR